MGRDDEDLENCISLDCNLEWWKTVWTVDRTSPHEIYIWWIDHSLRFESTYLCRQTSFWVVSWICSNVHKCLKKATKVHLFVSEIKKWILCDVTEFDIFLKKLPLIIRSFDQIKSKTDVVSAKLSKPYSSLLLTGLRVSFWILVSCKTPKMRVRLIIKRWEPQLRPQTWIPKEG